MTETLSRKDKAAFKKLVIIDRLVADTHSIMISTPSPYKEVREIMIDARHLSDGEEKRLLKMCRKAYLIAVEEEKAATLYNIAADVLDKNPDLASARKVSRLDKKYRAQLAAGKYRKARRTARRLYALAGGGSEHVHVSIVAADGALSGEGTARIVVNNRSESDVMVMGISAYSPDAGVRIGDERGFAVRQHGQRALRVLSERSDIPVNVTVSLVYDIGRRRYTQKQSFRFDRAPSAP